MEQAIYVHDLGVHVVRDSRVVAPSLFARALGVRARVFVIRERCVSATVCRSRASQPLKSW